MTTLQNKIDFAVIFRVENANPNGDPLNGNRPRSNYDNYGEVSDVALKRKIRDRLMESGHNIFVQSDDRKNDNAKSLSERVKNVLGNKLTAGLACETWFDVRAFGQLFAMKSGTKGGKSEGDTGISIGIRGPVTVQSAFSIEPLNISSNQIVRSAMFETPSDTMGMKHRVDRGVYVFFGSMNPQLAERTRFSDADADAIKQVLPRLFENDESSARPAGSMEVMKAFWWRHNCKSGQYSSAKVHRTLTVHPDGSYTLDNLADLSPEELNGY